MKNDIKNNESVAGADSPPSLGSEFFDLPTHEGAWSRGDKSYVVVRYRFGLYVRFPLGNEWSLAALPPRLRGGWYYIPNVSRQP